MTAVARGLVVAALSCIPTLLVPSVARAHDVPADATVVAFVRPAGHRLMVVVRLPAAALSSSSVLFGGVIIPIRASGSVDVMRAEPPLIDAARMVANLLPLYEGDRSLVLSAVNAVRLSRPDDRSFASFGTAVAQVTGAAQASDTELEPGQGFFDALLEYPIESDRSDFSIEPRVTALAERVVVAIQFLPAGSDSSRAYTVTADSGRFHLDPHWYDASLSFMSTGFVHILEGADHLLFLICLVIPLKRWQSLVPAVIAFTMAQSVTLVMTAYQLTPGGGWFTPLIDTMMAASIVYMAVENVFVTHPRRRWIMTFAFGLAQGFWFSFALRESLQFAGSHLFAPLLSFNLGVELGQLWLLAIVGQTLSLLFRHVVPERLASIVLSVIVAHVGWHRLVERGSRFLEIAWWPAWTEAAVPWLLLLLVIASLLRVISLGSRDWHLDAGRSELRVSS